MSMIATSMAMERAKKREAHFFVRGQYESFEAIQARERIVMALEMANLDGLSQTFTSVTCLESNIMRTRQIAKSTAIATPTQMSAGLNCISCIKAFRNSRIFAICTSAQSQSASQNGIARYDRTLGCTYSFLKNAERGNRQTNADYLH